MNKIYDGFAEVYDRIMLKYMPYSEWVDYLEDLLELNHFRGKRILDVACGTGTMLIKLARRGYECAGADGSKEMLKIARGKAEKLSLNIGFVRRDMRKLEIKEKFHAVTCLYDSINYLLTEKDMSAFLKGSYRALENNGLFIFDMNTEYGLRTGWGTKTKLLEDKELVSVWKTFYDRKKRTSYLRILAFHHRNGAYHRISELHTEKAFGSAEMKKMLRNTGFRDIQVYDDRTFNKPHAKTERAWYVARRF